MKIPLFDIDQTLITGRKILVDAYRFVFKKVYQVEASIEEVDNAGMISAEVIVETLKRHNFSFKEIRQKLPQAFKELGDYFVKNIKANDFIALPGAKELLKKLKEKRVLIGVLTGNIDTIGWEKLKRTKLDQYIDFGVFGNMAFKRKDLVPLALEEAKKILEKKIFFKNLVIIGDSFRDILCAKENQIEVIGVASGKNTKEELKKAGADLVIDSLLEKEKIFKFLGV